MPETAILRPAHADLVVRDPDTRKPLAADGEPKPLTTYWHRRIAEGDVVVVSAPVGAPAAE